MVISADEKKVLLERLQKARETKAAKAAATKAAKAKETPAAVREPEPPAPAPVAVPPPEPALEPVEKPAPSEPIDIPQVPDLVAMSRKKPAKKKKVESSDEDSDDSDDSDAELPPKKGKGKSKKQAYMKIKIYKEPKNAVAFQSLVEAIQDEQPEDTDGHRPPTPPPAHASIGRGRQAGMDIKNKTPAQSRTLPSPQELMRRAALEFFS
jgi:hypothetical protein